MATTQSQKAAADRGAKSKPAPVHPVAPKSAWKAIPVKPGRKVCRRCSVSRPVAEFSINRAHADSLNDFDRVCAAAYAAERRAAGPRTPRAAKPKAKAAAKAKPAAKPARTPVARSTKATGGQPRAPRAPRPARTPIARMSGTTVEAVA